MTAVVCLMLTLLSSSANAQPEGPHPVRPETKWSELKPLPTAVEVRFQQKDAKGQKFTRLGIRSGHDFQKVAMLAPQPSALVLDEFQASVEVNSSTLGLSVALRIVLPNFIDPRTSQPLVTWIKGQQCSAVNQWQRLTVAGNSRQVLQRIRQLRSELKIPKIDFTGAYFNAIGLLLEVHSGDTFVDIRSAQYGPIVNASESDTKSSDHLFMTNPDSADHDVQAALKIERDRVELNGQLIFPVIIADHGEPLDFFREVHGNMIWVSNARNSQRMQQLLDAGYVVLATPPHPEFDPADFSQPLNGLAPLQHSHPLPSAWILGTGISADQLPHLLAWAREVRSADKILHRPLFADMIEAEGVASRQIDAIGISQHAASLLQPFGKARNASYRRQNTTAQITLPWEWVQTEIAPDIAAWRKKAGATELVIEPEQILQQVFACLSAGSKGIGFWKSKALDSNDADDRETRIAMELAGLYLQILAPQLINGNLDGHIPVRTSATKNDTFRDIIRQPTSEFSYQKDPNSPDAAVIRSGGTAIILAAWWDDSSHFVPQAMGSDIAEMTVSTTETSAAWELSLTKLKGLRRNPTAGGLKLDLVGLDQHAIVLVTSNLEQQQQMEHRIRNVAEQAAGLWASLAQLKLHRVQRTVNQIDRLVNPPSGITPWVQQAIGFQKKASEALGRRDFPGCEMAARQCLQSLRVIQATYWKQAVQQLTTPTSSPHAVSFSTLPDHWKMMQQVQASQQSQRTPLLTSGDFENAKALFQGEWQQLEPNPDLFQTSADIVHDPQGAGHTLRIRSWTSDRRTEAGKKETALLISSTTMPLNRGDVILVTGRARLGTNLRSFDRTPLILFDDNLGPEFSVSPKLSTAWKPFRFYRQISEDSEVKLWLGLKGAGEVYLDDLKVVRVSVGGEFPLTIEQKIRANTRPVGYQGERR